MFTLATVKTFPEETVIRCCNALLIALLSPFVSAFGLGSNTYGVPGYLDIATFTINDYDPFEGENWDLWRANADGDKFFTKMQARLGTKYQSISCRRTFQEKDAAVTFENYTNAATNSSEFVFFAGHGDWPGVITRDQKIFGPNHKSYGGWTRWPFFSVCLALNTKWPLWYAPMFNGAHAIFGYESLTYEYKWNHRCNWLGYGCSTWQSEDVWNSFSDNWVNKGMFMYDAYVEAVRATTYNQGGFGVAPASVYCYGDVNGVWFIGGTEKVTNVFNGEVSYSSLNQVHRYEKYGTPNY